MAEEDVKERFRKFIDSITKKDVVAVIHHTDPDGVCSGVVMAKLVEKKRGKRIDLRFNQGAGEIPILDSTVNMLRKINASKVIITDLCVDQDPKNLAEIEKFAEILVMDHHKIYADISSSRTVFIKPDFISETKSSAYPASKLCFDMASEIEDMDDIDWVAALGVIGDCAFSSWDEFLDSVFDKYNIEKKENIFETALGNAASLISDAESFDSAKVEEAFNAVYESSSPFDLLESSLKNYMEVIESEISKWFGDFERKAEFFEDLSLAFYKIDSKYRIKAPLNTRLSLKYPDKTIIIMQDSDNGMISISARRRDEKVAVNDLLEKAVEGLEGASAGGHVPAAGGKFRKEDIEKFRKNAVELIKNGQV